MEKVRCTAVFWMDFKHVMDEWRRAAKELLSEDQSQSRDLGSQQVKTSADFEKIKQVTNHNERITLEIRFH